jgi:LacI family transcriptional regulator
VDAETTVNADSTARPAAAPGPGTPYSAPAPVPTPAPAPALGASPAQAAAAPGTALAVNQPPTIYDVARAAGVSIASVSRVLNGRRNPRPETRDRVLQAVAELGFVPDGAARALSVRLKEVAGVIIRLPWTSRDPEDLFADEEDSLQFPDMINRGIAEAAQRRGFDILVRSVDLDEHDPGGRTLALARKSDGLIVHDRVLDQEQLEWLGRQVPVVTMAAVATSMTANVRSDNAAGMRDLARHLLHDHGYRTISYIGGHIDSPDSIARFDTLAAEVANAGATLLDRSSWQGNYTAGGGARVINSLLDRGTQMPRAIVCANDQTAVGVLYALQQHGLRVPEDLAVTGFDDIPVARHLHSQLTTVRQRIRELGATAFEVLYSMINRETPAERDVVLPTTLIRRRSCGCAGGDPS